MQFISSPLAHVFLGSLVLAAFHFLYQHIAIRLKRRTLIEQLNCKPPARYPHKDPFFGLDFLWDIIIAVKSKTYLDRARRLYQENGNTFSSHSLTYSIHTIEPDNIKAVLSTNFKDYGISPGRKEAFLPLLGRSIIISDGAQWEHSRAFLRPSFARSQVGDLAMFEGHMSSLVAAIPRDGSEVDLGILFFRLTADVTTDFMFGESIGSLVQSQSFSTQFMEAFHNVQTGCEERWRRGRLADFLPHSKFRKSVKQVHAFIDEYVGKAIEYRKAQSTEQYSVTKDAEKTKGRYILLRELGKATDDRKLLRGELLTIFLAGRDTTASLLCNLFFILAKRADIWRQLRNEVNELKGEKPTFEQLNRMDYVRYCLNESLRLHPPLPHNARVALKDTMLPTGGGPDAKSPIFVPAGTEVQFDISALHQRQDLWGEDAGEFRPERWKTEKASWKYLPFNGGPRNCIGQQFALTEASYAVVRLAQEFTEIRSRDEEPWTEHIGVVCTLANGVKVSLIPV